MRNRIEAMRFLSIN